MKIRNLTQPPFETTLMGVVKAVLDHYGHEVSDAFVYGGSGHAFLINVHEALCPSGPYCWNHGPMMPLLANLGVKRTDLGFYHRESPAEDRAAVEERLRDHLDRGRPCSLLNMDHQLVLRHFSGMPRHRDKRSGLECAFVPARWGHVEDQTRCCELGALRGW